MVLVDTSVWIRVYRERNHPLGQMLWHLTARDEAAICGAIWVEFIGGFRDATRRADNADRMAAFQWLDTNRAAYEIAANWKSLVPALGAVDLMIAATAFENDAELMTLDSSFAALKPHGLKLLERV